ncbi:MAG TPA: hypothetical protein VH280_09140 [Verrucomicrobiae bacterium]|jgi:hypothetical protein|nr:hypothetical protein [Verrucomicrobiae bacterium]
MAYTFNGIGTTFYGQRDFRVDGSYITTEWVVIMLIPIVPLRSLRVRYQGPAEQRISIGIGSAESYAVLEKTIPNWRQVLCVYSYTAFVIAWMVAVACCYGYFFQSTDMTLSVILIFVSFTLPALLPIGMRVLAKTQAAQSQRRLPQQFSVS